MLNLLVALVALVAVPAVAAEPVTTWEKPPPEVQAVLDAPEIPSASASPDGATLLLLTPVRYPPLADRAVPALKLAGERLDPRNGGPWGVAGSTDPVLLRVSDGAKSPIALPADARVLEASFSADGARVALVVRESDHVGLWVGDVGGKGAEVPGLQLDDLLGSSVQWLPDQKRLLVKRVDPGRAAPPLSPALPDGPRVLETSGGSASSTYEAKDLLVTSYDDALFTYYGTSSLAVVDPSAGTVTGVGGPDVYGDVSVSPDGKYVLVERLTGPWSHEVTWERFAHDEEVWTIAGDRIATVAKLPVADAVPIQGEPTGPRSVGWRPTSPSTLVWFEALDGGDPGAKVEARDRVMALSAPFTTFPKEIWHAKDRAQGIWWGKGVAVVQEYERERRWKHVYALDPDKGPTSGRPLYDLSVNDRYADPGSPLLRPQANGAWVMLQDGDDVLFSGAGGSPAGDRPFLDRRSLKTGKVERLWRSGADVFESLVRVADPKAKTFLVRRESETEVPNVHRVALGAKTAAADGEAAYARGKDDAITAFTDPTPQIRGVTKKIVQYQRADGTPLSFKLYLPAGYKEGTPLPTVMYAYPLEYSDPATAGQVRGSEHTFDRFAGGSPLFFTLEGYAVLMDTAFPVIGDPDTAYDTFVDQLVADAKAAIDKAVELGVTDRSRVGVMGHSHGALMTATLLAHCDYFKAGIARSGAYNQTIRPFGFQNERRTLWAAEDAYIHNTVTMYAPDIKAPILLVHGQMDENPGTLPFQSERLYEAIRGSGGTAKLLMLPFEGHGYVSRESIEELLAEQIGWFDKYVKGAAK